MANVLNKLLDYFGIEENEADDEIYENENYEDESREDNVVELTNRGRNRRNSQPANVVSMPSSAKQKMIVFKPVSYEETQSIIDNLKSRKPIIVNMEDLELDCAQRILDFMAGAICALDGEIYKISRGIFVVAPANYDIIGSEDENDETY